MNKLKKLASLVLAMVMALALAAPAFAMEGTDPEQPAESTGTTQPTATITAPENGHTYEIYQIFTGDLAGGVLSNVKWGKNGTGTEGEAVPSNVLEALENANGTDLTKLAVIEQYWDKNSTPVATICKDGTTPSTTQPTGYYLFKDVTELADDAEEGLSINVVELVGDITITNKVNSVEFEKKVKDTNDSDANDTTNNVWMDSADYDIGDSVPFQLKATLGANVDKFETYYVQFSDTLSAGLTYNDDAVIKIDDKVVTEQFTLDVDQQPMTFTCEDVLALGAHADSVITVEYTATLNTSAVSGSTGNDNKATLTFSRQPGTDATGTTPEDIVVVFTFDLQANKVNQDKEPLTGAGFTLYKFDAEKNDWVAVGEEVKGEEMTEFNWKGIDAGQYKLVETTTPAGYNTIEDIEFTVEATHDESSDNPTLTGLVVKDAAGTILSGDGEDASFSATVSSGAVSTTVVNNKGATLPSTGGIGTTIFYVVGGVLAAGAVILLITKRRMNIEK